MALPKRRHSKQRKRKRRTHWKLKNINVVSCSNCGEIILPHRICPYCGYYKGRPIISKQES
ncbi:50S ribosomal protein L32 [bacterium]|nr:MAG: 50S ribosomal protein L32 [bacterium]